MGNCAIVESPEGILYKRNVTHQKRQNQHMRKKRQQLKTCQRTEINTQWKNHPLKLWNQNYTEPNNTDEPENSDKPNNTDEPENSVETEVAVDRPDVSRRPIRTRQLPARFNDFRL